MPKWKGNWTFNNSSHRKYKTSGQSTVTASNQPEAVEMIKEDGSRQTVGTSMMSYYIDVSNVVEVK